MIPLPARFARKVEVTDTDPNSLLDLQSHVMTLRCKACYEEALYTESEFIDCEDAPKTRVARWDIAVTYVRPEN